MAMKFVDRMLTVVITATLTSAAWIVFGGTVLENTNLTEEPEGGAEDAEGTGAAPATMGDTEIVTPPPQAETARLVVPVLGVERAQLVDSFADDRSGAGPLHEAIDIMAPAGTSVISAAPGTIERLYRSEAGGNTIYVRSNDRKMIYYYAHLGEYAPGLNEGQQVRRGQRLGMVGTSGNASPATPHLHFAMLRTSEDAEWWEPATALNPYLLLGSGG